MRIAVFASGAGSNFLSLARSCIAGDIPAEIVTLVASKESIGALEHAKDLNISSQVFDPKQYSHLSEWDLALTNYLLGLDIDLIVLAGYLKKIGPQLLSKFANKIVNTHPSLLPKFGGHGMYGSKVHKAVIEAGEKESGITVHKVSAEYDKGQILAQSKVFIDADETWETLEQKIKTRENKFIVEVVLQIVKREIKLC